MSVVNWGLLEKSLVDDETIEEAIARLIQVHDDDETSHLDTGQSLQSHKVSEIIDHVLGSVVADKFSDKQTTIQTSFDSLDGWSKSVSGVTHYFGAVYLATTGTLDNLTYISTEPNDLFSSDQLLSNMMFQARVRIYGSNSRKQVIGLGDIDTTQDGIGFGFSVHDGNLYGYFRNWGDLYEVLLEAVGYSESKTLRAQVFPSDNKVHYFVNGVDSGQITIPEIAEHADFYFYFYAKCGLGTYISYLDIHNVVLSRD